MIRYVLRAVGRRWYVSFALIALAALLYVSLARDGGLYTARTVVSFMWPTATVLETKNGSTERSIVAFAGIVATVVNDGRPAAEYSSGDAPYYGAGIREGVLVSLENRGNQWVVDHPVAEIEIQIVGRTHTWVADMQKKMIERVFQVAEQQQTEIGTPADKRVAAEVVPMTQTIEEIRPGRTGYIGAAAALASATVIIMVWTSVVLDRSMMRRRRRRRHRRVEQPLLANVPRLTGEATS